MATLQQITQNAFRELGLTAVGSTPDTAEYSEALTLLQNIAISLYGHEMGENLTDVNIGSASTLNASAKALDSTSEITSLYIPNNILLSCNLTAPLTIYLHPKPRNGCRVQINDAAGNFATFPLTVQGNGRKILSGTPVSSVTLNTNSAITPYFYRQDLGQWVMFDVSVDTLQSPFNPAFDDLLVFMLAKRLVPRFGATWSDIQEQELTRMMTKFRSVYRQETPAESEYALIRLPSSLRSLGYMSNSSSDDFSKGFI